MYDDANKLKTLYWKTETFVRDLQEFCQNIYDMASTLGMVSVEYNKEEEELLPSPEERANTTIERQVTIRFAFAAKELAEAWEGREEIDGWGKAEIGVRITGSMIWLLAGALPRVYTNLHGLRHNPGPNDIIMIGMYRVFQKNVG